ncbi:hypothetical protein G6F66_013783 [Rhizopus arrhizus]|nr:hypothetical protein G6F66_013783 [Rhizopus arrhizus]
MPAAGRLMGSPHEGPLDRMALRQAAQWLMRLHAGAEPAPEAFQEWERWRAQSPDNERAWQRAQQFNAQFSTLPPELARSALNRKMPRRKALAALGGMAVGLPAAWAAWRMAPWSSWTAEYRTATGVRREIRLADGSVAPYPPVRRNPGAHGRRPRPSGDGPALPGLARLGRAPHAGQLGRASWRESG